MDTPPDAFSQFWSAYPRKTAKGDAKRQWEKASRHEPNLLALCLTALAWQRRQVQWTRDGGQYVPYPATWLRGERWADESPVVSVTVETVPQETRERASDWFSERQAKWDAEDKAKREAKLAKEAAQRERFEADRAAFLAARRRAG